MDIKMNHKEGNKKGNVVLYGLSTCQWCEKTKDLLDELKVDYYYVYVDMADYNELIKIKEEIKKYNPAFSFPTLVLDQEDSIIGFDEKKIREKFKKEEDLDIVCPCDYRDPDLDEYGTCYCALYVDREILEGRKNVKSIPDRRYLDKKKIEKERNEEVTAGKKIFNLEYPVWRCKGGGYLCAREHPPEICPVCKAKRERFEIFI